MRPEAKAVCGSCPHQGALHILPIGACQVNGCRCQHFTDPAKPEPASEDERTMLIRIPVGFYAVVSVFPVAETDGS